ncbi:hypothetical protein H4219_000138 [Mycoemilia scoparia]|uniref:Phosphatidylglycerol/phosphatidylinositol transfer protein n=1 Tax=Mycoemilia scoparia TaxID=417184 RepID=A0A9W8A6T6_9FUNG|nr:hypothetical protein H4219_000138 [Mycoemilia scoparia]
MFLVLCQIVLSHPFSNFGLQQVQQAWRSFKSSFDFTPHVTEDEGRPINELITDYSAKDDLAEIKYVHLDPMPPRRSSELRVDGLGFIKERIEGATADVIVKYGSFQLLSRTYDLCDEMQRELNRTCPVEAGEFKDTVITKIPGYIFPGWYTIEATAKRTEDDKQIGKVIVHVRF